MMMMIMTMMMMMMVLVVEWMGRLVKIQHVHRLHRRQQHPLVIILILVAQRGGRWRHWALLHRRQGLLHVQWCVLHFIRARRHSLVSQVFFSPLSGR